MNFNTSDHKPFRHLLLAILLSCSITVWGQNAFDNLDSAGTRPGDMVKKYLLQGDRAYASKSSYISFEQSLVYYDSARMIAMSSGDSLLLGYVYFSYAKVYDAWNKAPQKTVEYFKAAERLLRKNGAPLNSVLYAKYLLAHNYEKAHDSADACRVLAELAVEIRTLPDTLRYAPLLAEMALVSTEAGNYTLASNLLSSIQYPDHIQNDPNSYRYRDHFVLTKARTDVYYLKNKHSAWLDSLDRTFSGAGSTFDSLYYSDELANMYDYLGQYKASAQYLRINQKLFARINEQSGIGAMQNKLLASELSFEKSRTEAELLRARQGKFFMSFLVFLVFVISIFSMVLYSQKKASAQQAKEVASINKDLETQSEQNKLLSLEVHHRTKNNLQMILSLLQMQERTLDNEEARERLQEARARVESIADLHENLLNHNHQFDLNSYISTLINNMVNSTHGDKKVVAHLSVDPIPLPHKIELPLALILNEWITNSVKYTQSKTDVLGIYLKLYREGENILIHYWDNGLPADGSENSPGFGSQIIPLLVRQIKGQLSTDPHSKYYYILQIPYANRN